MRSPIHKQCRQCGEWFTLKPTARPSQRFCTASCAAIYRNSQPKWRKAHSKKIKARTDPEKLREQSRAAWRDPETRMRMIASRKKSANTEKRRVRMAELSKKLWADPAYRKRMAARKAEALRKLWADPAFREKKSAETAERNKRLWANPDYKHRVGRSIARGQLAPLVQKRRRQISAKLAQTPEARARSSALMKARWQDPEQAASMAKAASKTQREKLRDPVYRAKKVAALTKHARSPEHRARMAELNRKKWSDPEYAAARKAWWTPERKAELAERNRKRWANPTFKERVAAKISKAKRAAADEVTQ